MLLELYCIYVSLGLYLASLVITIKYTVILIILLFYFIHFNYITFLLTNKYYYIATIHTFKGPLYFILPSIYCKTKLIQENHIIPSISNHLSFMHSFQVRPPHFLDISWLLGLSLVPTHKRNMMILGLVPPGSTIAKDAKYRHSQRELIEGQL